MTDGRPDFDDTKSCPVRDNPSMRTIGERGLATLRTVRSEEISRFDRKRVPERVVHARGTGDHGWFDASSNGCQACEG